MALRLAAVCVVALVAAASAAASTQKRTTTCLKAHHVLVAAKSPRSVTRFGVRVLKLESFSFHGMPAKVYDSGTLIFERTAAEAVHAQRTLYSRFAAFEIKRSGGNISPYRIRLNLRRTEFVRGNVVVVWNSYPQKRAAKRILYGCLR
jgi:hypothetical protein